MSSKLLKKRRETHQKVVLKMSELVSTLSAFLLIFSILLTISNWPAYSRIIQDWIDPTVMAQQLNSSLEQRELQNKIAALEAKLIEEVDPSFEVGDESSASKFFELEDVGEIYPEEMRLEVPKVFAGTIPIRGVNIENFDFADLYNSENKIQDALRDGVVHYPYTANPNQYGNVFITGHSSYYPWDEGRYKQIFALLYKLQIGDEYYIYFKGNKYTYKVFEIFEIEPDDVSVLEQPVDEKISTLMTCTPVGTVLRRLIVKSELFDVQ